MYKYIISNLIYVFWTLLNVCHDSIFKYYNHLHFSLVFLIRYILVFLITLIFNFIYNIPSKISKENQKDLINFNFFKSITTLLAIIFVYKQMATNSLFSSNLIFFSIPLFELIIGKFFLKPQENLDFKSFINKYSLVIINNVIIMIFFIKEIYLYGFYKYFYGFLGAFMFAISNILILKTKKVWENNLKFIITDIYWFSVYMIILCLLSIFYYKLKFSYILSNFYNIWNLSFIIFLLLGVVIQFVLYYLFFKHDFTPSNVLVSIDLISSLIFGFFCGNEKINGLEIFIILLIIATPFFKKVLFLNK